MRSPFRHIGLAIASLALAAAAVASSVSFAFRRAVALLDEFRPTAAQLDAKQPRPVELVQACAYSMRIEKRERPRNYPGQWRMCPSV